MSIIDDKGWWQDKTGDYKHPARIDIDEQLEDELVEKIHLKGLKLQAALLEYKDFVYTECYAFLDNLREEYNIERLKGKTERITLKNFNGTKEFKISVNNLIDYNQIKVELAKEKFLQYANLKIKDIEDNDIKTIVLGALEPKNGKYDDKDIQKLINWGIENPIWKEGVDLLQNARITIGTKSYINLRQKEDLKLDGAWEGIILDLAALPVQETVIQKNIEFVKWFKNINKNISFEAKKTDETQWRQMFNDGLSIDEALNIAGFLETNNKEEIEDFVEQIVANKEVKDENKQ